MDMIEAVLYLARQEGRELGLEIGKMEVRKAAVVKMSRKFGFTDKQIAKMVDMKNNFVRQIRQQLANK